MFDTLALPKQRDDQALRAGSFFLSASLIAGLLTLGFAGGPRAVVPEPESTPMPVLIALGVPELPVGAPAAPRGGSGGSGRRSAPETPPPEAPEVAPAVTPPESPPDGSATPTEPVSDLPSAGPGGPGGDGPPGDGPPGGGGPSGDGPGGGGGGTVAVHHLDLVVRTRVTPRFPEAARAFARPEERCVVVVEVDEAGVPADVSAPACPVVFRGAAIEAARQWRWAPYLVNGVPSRAQFKLEFVFRLGD